MFNYQEILFCHIYFPTLRSTLRWNLKIALWSNCIIIMPTSCQTDKPLSKVESLFYLGSQAAAQCSQSTGGKSINQQDSKSQRISLWIRLRKKRRRMHWWNCIMTLSKSSLITDALKIKGNPTSSNWNEILELTLRRGMIANDMTLSNTIQGAAV